MRLLALAIISILVACGAESKKAGNTATPANPEGLTVFGTYTAPVAPKAWSEEEAITTDEQDTANTWIDNSTGKHWLRAMNGEALREDDFRSMCPSQYVSASDEDLVVAIRDGLFDSLPAANGWAWGAKYDEQKSTIWYESRYDNTANFDNTGYDVHAVYLATFYCVK